MVKLFHNNFPFSKTTGYTDQSIAYRSAIDALFEKSITTSTFGEISKDFKNLAESYHNSGFEKEARGVNKLGSELGLFMSEWQRGFYDYQFFFPGLTAKPIWLLNELGDVGGSLGMISHKMSIMTYFEQIEHILKYFYNKSK